MTDPSPNRPSPTNPEITAGQLLRFVWSRLGEMRVVMVILAALAVGGLAGAVIPQKQPAELYQDWYGGFFGRLVPLLGLDRVFSSWWFLLIGGILMVSLVACTRRLWRLSAGRWRIPTAEAAASRFAEDQATTFTAPSRDELLAPIGRAARRAGYSARDLGEHEGARWIHLSRFRWAAWGPALTHYSIFLIGMGALLGSLPAISVDTTAVVVEGETYKDPDNRMPFDLRLNSFEVRPDPESGGIENYYSDLSVLESGQEKLHRTIRVNHPLKYRGFYISQSSWGMAGAEATVTVEGERYSVFFPLEPAGENDQGLQWRFQKDNAAVILPDRKTALVARWFVPDAVERQGRVEGTGSGVLGKPALGMSVVVVADDGKHDIRDLRPIFTGQSAPIPGGEVTFERALSWSGLGIRRDPGVPLVWTGFVGCLLGMMLVFYVRTSQATVRLVVGEEGVSVSFATTGPGRDNEDMLRLRSALHEAFPGAGDMMDNPSGGDT